MKAMKITRRSLAAEAVSRWLDAYGEDGGGYGADKAEVLRKLRALGDRPNPDDVDAVIGNKSWTQVPSCDGCDDESPRPVVRVGQAQDYESSTADLCHACIADAARLYRASKPRNAST